MLRRQGRALTTEEGVRSPALRYDRNDFLAPFKGVLGATFETCPGRSQLCLGT
jgi:hypothetical protein